LTLKNAFLNGKSDFSIYARQTDGFVDIHFPEYVILLLKSLYGLKQASPIWYLTLYEAVIYLGFTASEFDPCIFISTTRNLIIAIYVDDILAIGPQNACHEFANLLNEKFSIVNQGPISSFLGINAQRQNGLILLNQIGYINKLAQRFQIDSSIRSVPTPLEHSLPLVKPGERDNRVDPSYYKELMVSLNQQFSLVPISHSLYRNHRNSTKIQASCTSTLLVAFLNTQFQQSTSQSNTAEPAQFKSTDTRTRTGDPTSHNKNPQRDMFSCWTVALYHGPQRSKLLSHYQQWRPNIWPYPTRHENCLLISRSSNLSPSNSLLRSRSSSPTNIAAESIVKREPDYQRSKHIDIRYHFV
jgi:hypothetical protein